MQPIPGQAVQVLGCLHHQHHLEMLLGLLDVAQLRIAKARPYTVYGFWGLISKGAVQRAGSPQPVAMRAIDRAQVLEKPYSRLQSASFISSLNSRAMPLHAR